MASTETQQLLGAQLRDLVDALDDAGELRRIDGVDWNLELGAITEMLALRDGPALLFDHVKGYPPGYRVLTNVTNNPRRVGMLFGLSRRSGGIEIVRAIRDRFTALQPLDPVEVRSAAYEEQSQVGPQVNLFALPSPLWHEHDGGRYVGTACAEIGRAHV